MSHIHIPDGVLPVIWCIIGYALTGMLLFFSIRRLEKGDLKKKVPYLGVVCALMLVTMSVPLGFLPFHINLTVLTGIIAGPALGFTAVFIVNLFLSFLGHGGITVVGVNTLILGIEVILGSQLFRLGRKYFRVVPAVALATLLALLMSTALMVGIVGVTQIGWSYAMPHQHDGAHTTAHDTHVASHDEHASNEPFAELLSEISFFKLSGMIAVGLILLLGIGLEMLVTVFMVKFFNKVRPDLIK